SPALARSIASASVRPWTSVFFACANLPFAGRTTIDAAELLFVVFSVFARKQPLLRVRPFCWPLPLAKEWACWCKLNACRQLQGQAHQVWALTGPEPVG